MRCSKSARCFSFSRNHRSTLVMSWISWQETPRRRASKITNRRSSSWSWSFWRSSSSLRAACFSWRRQSREMAAPRTAFMMPCSKLWPMAMTSPVAFIWVAQGALGVNEFVKGPLGQLDHHIVQRGLEAGEGLAGDGVGDLVKGVADGDLGGHAGDGIARGLGGQGGRAGHAGD